jgi:hypothetical protein
MGIILAIFSEPTEAQIMSKLKAILKEDFDKGDPWGSAMTAFFTVANEVNYREGEGATPAAWGYKPGATEDPRDSDDHLYEACLFSTIKELIHFGKVLERYTRNLDRNGFSY